MKKATALFLSFIITMLTITIPCFASQLDDTAGYLINTIENPTVSSIGGEWAVLGLARSGLDIDGRYFETYYENVLSYVKSKDGILHSRKNTEYSRVVIALSAIGKNPENVAGYNLIAPLLDYEQTVYQGINGPIWALIALDCNNYGSDDIRSKYIAKILECEKQNGGWAISDTQQYADADITAMAIIALSKYQDNPEVKSATDRAVSLLSSIQNDNAGFYSYNTEDSESAAQVLTALSSIGISYNDSRFIKNGKTLIDNIYSFKLADGSFSHTDQSNLMATEQCFYALVSAKRLSENKPPLFDMSDVDMSEIQQIGLQNKNPDINISLVIFPEKTFSDVVNHKNRTAIEELAKRGIINGISDNTFAPDQAMTRAEFATIIVRALGLPTKVSAAFADVLPSDWYAEYVGTAYRYKIVSGVSQTEFNPEGLITTEQAMVMVCRAAELCGLDNKSDDFAVKNILAEFTDYTTVSPWAEKSVAFCFEKGFSDRSALEINPLSHIKRCQVADTVYNLLKGTMLI